MVDLVLVAVLSLVFGAIGTIFGILQTLLNKRKELRKSLQGFQQRTRERLNQTTVSIRRIGGLVVVSIWVGMGICYYIPNPDLARWIGLGLGAIWFLIGVVIFGNPDSEEEEEELMTRSEVGIGRAETERRAREFPSPKRCSGLERRIGHRLALGPSVKKDYLE